MVRFENKGNYEIHYPPEKLRQKVKSAGGKGLKEIEKDSENLFLGLSSEFLASVQEGAAAINETLKIFREGAPTDGDRDRIHKIAHDLKDVGSSFGFPLIGEISSLVCDLSHDAIPVGKVKTDLIAVLTQTLDEAAEDRIRTSTDPRADKLTASLAKIRLKS